MRNVRPVEPRFVALNGLVAVTKYDLDLTP